MGPGRATLERVSARELAGPREGRKEEGLGGPAFSLSKKIKTLGPFLFKITSTQENKPGKFEKELGGRKISFGIRKICSI